MAAGRRSTPMLAVVSVLLLNASASVANAQQDQPPKDGEGPIVVRPVDPGGIFGGPSVEADARSPGAPPVAGGAPASRSRPKCEHVKMSEELARRYWESYASAPMPPGYALYQIICDGTFVGWLNGGGPNVGGAPPSPAQLAQQAAAQLVLSLPVPRHSPDLRLANGRRGVVVGAPTWVWTEPTSFAPLSRRVDAGPVWAQVTARPVGLEFDPGDSSPVVGCAGPGTPFDRSRFGVHEPSPDCGFVYAHSSFGRPGDQVTATYAIRWRVSWVGATAAGPTQGVLPELVSQATSSFVVAEAQALRTQ